MMDITSILKRRKYHGLLIPILILALVLDLLFYTGYYASDDRSLYTIAYLLAQEKFEFIQSSSALTFICDGLSFDFGGLRFVITIPLALIFKITSGSFFWLCFYFIIYHLGIVILTFKLGKLIHNWKVGIIAAFLIATLPLMYIFAGSMLPDIPLTFWILASGYMLFKLYKNKNKYNYNKKFSLYNKSTFLIIAGFLLGLAYSAKISALIFVIPFFMIIINSSKKFFDFDTLKSLMYYLLGFLLFVCIETCILSYFFDGFNTRIGLLFISTDGSSQTQMFEISKYPSIFTFYKSRFIEAHNDLQWPLSHFTLYIIYFCLIVYPIIKNSSKLLYITFLWPLLYLIIGIYSFSIYSVSSIQPRYFTIIMPQVMIILAYLIYTTYTLLNNRFSGLSKYFVITLKCIFICVIFVFVLLNFIKTKNYIGTIYKSEYAKSYWLAYKKALENYPDYKVILGDRNSYRLKPFFLRELYMEQSFIGNKTIKQYEGELPVLLVTQKIVNDKIIAKYFPEGLINKISSHLVDMVVLKSRWDYFKEFIHQEYIFSFAQNIVDNSHYFNYPTYIYLLDTNRSEINKNVLFISNNNKFPVFNKSKERECGILPTNNGYSVFWRREKQLNEENINSSIHIKGLDYKYYKNNTSNHLGSFMSQKGNFSFGMDMISLTHNKTKVLIYIWLYYNGEYVGFKKSDPFYITDSKRLLCFNFNSETPIDQFRFSIYIFPANYQQGGINFGNATLRFIPPNVGSD